MARAEGILRKIQESNNNQWDKLVKLHKELQDTYKKTEGDESRAGHLARKKAQTKVKNQAEKVGIKTFAPGGKGSEDYDELVSSGGKLPPKEKYVKGEEK